MINKNPWNENWMNTQQDLWKTWADMVPQAAMKAETPADYWAKGFESWWQSFTPKASNPVEDFYEKMLNMGKGFFSMAEGMGVNAENGLSLDAVNQWLGSLEESLMQFSTGYSDQADKHVKNFMAFWDMPMDTLNKTFSSMSPFPGDFMESAHAHEAARSADQFREQMTHFLSTPALGYSRESQEQLQRLSQLMLQYQSAMQAYKLAFAKVGVQSIQAFQERIKEIAANEDDQKIDSLRRFYDIWVDECESVYAGFAMSEEYQTLYGNVVNTQMAVKNHMGMMTDQVLEAMNIPSRLEINTLQKRLQEQRRDMHALRAEIAALKTTNKPAARKATSKKSVTAKKSTTKKSAASARKSSPRGGRK